MKHRLSYEKKKGLYGYGFIALWFIGALMFFIIPVCKSFFYSFNDVSPETGYLARSWVGMANYKRAFMTDPTFRQYLVSALKDMALNLPIIVVFSMFVAIIINQKFRGRTFARAVFFLPVLVATGPVLAVIKGDISTNGISSGEQFSALFQTDLVDELLQFLGIYNLNEQLTMTIQTITSDIFNLLWSAGIQILIFLAALQQIPVSAKEAASMEGATGWEFFWKITFPMISPMILANLIYTVIDTFIDSENPVMSIVLAQSRSLRYGLSAAMAWIYFLIVAVALAIIVAIVSKFVFYEND